MIKKFAEVARIFFPAKIKIRKKSRRAVIPSQKTALAIGYDLYVPYETTIPAGRSVVKLGLEIEMPAGIEGKIEARSGFSAKGIEGIPVKGRGFLKEQNFDADVIPGKVDPDYRGEIGVIIRNNGRPFKVKTGTRIAQITFYKVPKVRLFESIFLSKTERGAGGFGHTGSN